MLNEKIDQLKKELREYGNLVEEMIEKSLRGLIKKDKALLLEVIEKDEPKANAREIDIDELCTNTIAQFDPKAKELRVVLMILKINNDLERMADQIVNISDSSLYIIEHPELKKLIDIPRMGEIAASMLSDGIHSFIQEDAELAREICQRDDLVDDLRDQILLELITFMHKDSETIQRALHLMRISANFERIADLATNICEDAIFVIEGKVIKHHHDE